jgi:hypothetical protein
MRYTWNTGLVRCPENLVIQQFCSSIAHFYCLPRLLEDAYDEKIKRPKRQYYEATRRQYITKMLAPFI